MTQKRPQAAAQVMKTRRAISKEIAKKSARLHTAVTDKLTSLATFRKLKPQQQQKLGLALANLCKVSSRILAEQAGQKKNAVPAGTESAPAAPFTALLDTVDFPGFVSSLIEGTFKAIVDSSIEQMQAYADLLNAVATALSEFDKDRRMAGNRPGRRNR